MTDLTNNKFVPKTPETYTVSYLETNQVKKSRLSPAARAKVINRSGSNYISSNQDFYGPGEETTLNMETTRCPQEATFEVYTFLNGDYFFSYDNSTLRPSPKVSGGKIKDQDFSGIQRRINDLKSGKIKVFKGKSSSFERTEECIKYEAYFEISLANALDELKKQPHYGLSTIYTFTKP